MSLDNFHSAVADWFHREFDTPTQVQTKAWHEIRKRRNTLISAPTGSGKTLAAFLAIIDDLVKQGLESDLPEKTQVVYVSPLKALSNDIEKNLRIPLRGIKKELENSGLPYVRIKVSVRTGDTTSYERTKMTKHPPHILVTTPESLYLLLTARRGREMLSDVHTVIVDEIHALVNDKRGSHLSLSLERLNDVSTHELVRIGLSATQKPIKTIARFLVGSHKADERDSGCTIIDVGHERDLDIGLELPDSPLTAIMSNEVWGEIYDRLEQLINSHDTTLIFANTRRLVERITHNLTERMGSQIIAAHHGSISKEIRLEAEKKLKSGELKAIVATASLELGIDIGSVDLVCQIGSPKLIATFLQRVGRSGHTIKGVPKGRLFPLTLDELVESVALLDAVRRGELDAITIPEKPLDILAQQIVAEVACGERGETELYDLFRKAYPYRALARKEFDEVVEMLSRGFATQRGRRAAYIHHDKVNRRLRARKGARLTALLSGGAIPDSFDFDVILEPTGTFIGTVNEDFAIESIPGDIFLLGNHSWRILKVNSGKVRVEDAQGLPPTIPFWFGEAPGRSAEFSLAVSRLREEISERVGDLTTLFKNGENGRNDIPNDEWKQTALSWLEEEIGIDRDASDQLVSYLGTVKSALGAMPSQNKLVMERFFDEAGAMHLVIHSPFGSRLNRAWGLALRKRFCRQFNFELQAAAAEDSIILSLGATHSFPLEEVYSYLSPKTVRHVLTQALLDSPMFEVRWRWNATRALAVKRRWADKKVPPAVQRIQSEDLIAQVFPDQLACIENISGEREIPDHPLVNQTIHDCLYEAMDIENLEGLLEDIQSNRLNLVAKDLREPSPLSQQILNARPYSFLDNVPLEERRTHAVQNRRWLDPSEASELAQLDMDAIHNVKGEAFPEAESADELHDALVLSGFLTPNEGKTGEGTNDWQDHFEELIRQQRVSVLRTGTGHDLWIAAERFSQLKKIFPGSALMPEIQIPERLLDDESTAEAALVEIIRGRMEILGPVTSDTLAESMGIDVGRVDKALLSLENEGSIFRGSFTPGIDEQEWCDRRLLARIHRYTLSNLRKEIQPVSAADYMRFLFSWHGIDSDVKPEGSDALKKVLEQLEGFESSAASWEGDLLTARMKDYDYKWLDGLCLSGGVVWGRFSERNSINNGGKTTSPIKTTPITLVKRANLQTWKQLGFDKDYGFSVLTNNAKKVYRFLEKSGASFFGDIESETGLLNAQAEEAVSELVAKGLVTSDSYTGLRSLLIPMSKKTKRKRNRLKFKMEEAGRWSLLRELNGSNSITKVDRESLTDIAWILLRRYGVVFRKVVTRESFAPSWRELVRVYRLLEARGEIRGGRFVEGVWGEQFALPEAVGKLRAIRRKPTDDQLISVSAADPLNLTGIVTPGKRISSHYKNRILYKNGVPVAVKEGKDIRYLADFDGENKWRVRSALIRRNISPRLRAYLGKGVS